MTSRILLVSSDLGLSLTLQRKLDDAFEIVSLDFDGVRDALRRGREVPQCIVVDARSSRKEALRTFTELSQIAKDERTKRVLLAPLSAFRARDAVALLGETSPVLILSDSDPIADLVRTHLADPATGSALVTAHRCLLTVLPKRLHRLTATAFSIGPGQLTVSRLASCLGEHYTTLERHLDRDGLPPPGALVDLVRASFAVTRISSCDKPVKEVARVLGYGEPKGLRRLLQRTFRVTGFAVRSTRKTNSLAAHLQRWASAHLNRA